MSDLATLVSALNARRTEFLDALESISPTLLATKPGGSKWSPIQIGEHLARVESGYAHVMGRQIEKGDGRRDVGEPSERSVEGLIRAMRTPAQFKVPDGAPTILPSPDATPTLAELRTDWLRTGERWQSLSEAFPAAWMNEGIVSHPVGGAMTFGQLLRFLESHIEHHLHQLGRTVRALAH